MKNLKFKTLSKTLAVLVAVGIQSSTAYAAEVKSTNVDNSAVLVNSADTNEKTKIESSIDVSKKSTLDKTEKAQEANKTIEKSKTFDVKKDSVNESKKEQSVAKIENDSKAVGVKSDKKTEETSDSVKESKAIAKNVVEKPVVTDNTEIQPIQKKEEASKELHGVYLDVTDFTNTDVSKVLFTVSGVTNERYSKPTFLSNYRVSDTQFYIPNIDLPKKAGEYIDISLSYADGNLLESVLLDSQPEVHHSVSLYRVIPLYILTFSNYKVDLTDPALTYRLKNGEEGKVVDKLDKDTMCLKVDSTVSDVISFFYKDTLLTSVPFSYGKKVYNVDFSNVSFAVAPQDSIDLNDSSDGNSQVSNLDSVDVNNNNMGVTSVSKENNSAQNIQGKNSSTAVADNVNSSVLEEKEKNVTKKFSSKQKYQPKHLKTVNTVKTGDLGMLSPFIALSTSLCGAFIARKKGKH